MNIKTLFKGSLLCLLSLQTITSLAAEQNINTYPNRVLRPQLQDIRDPFTPSKLMFDAVGRQPGSTGGSYGFSRSINSSVPAMRLRGYIAENDDDPIALLEVAGSRTFLVHEGDEINIDPSQPLSVIRITAITRQSITVETGLLGSIRVQR